MTIGWLNAESRLRVALLAVLVGLVAGFGAVAFRLLVALFRNLFFFGRLSFVYDANFHTLPSAWGVAVILVPVVGAVVVAFLVKDFAEEARGAGVAEVIDAVYYQRGVIRPVVALVKALAASVSLGSGASVGREGPIIQIGATFGSTVGQLVRMADWERAALIACGAAGGIAATFNTPIGGVLFAIEIIMAEISARTLVPVALATGTATLVGQTFFGDHPVFHLATVPERAHILPLGTFAADAGLGLLIGLMAVAFIRGIYLAQDLFDRVPGNYYFRHGLGMLVLGLVMYLLMAGSGHYYVEGAGYATVRDLLTGALNASYLLALLFALKLLVTAVSLGSGASGGVFSPALFMGATVGAGYGALLNQIFPGHVDPAVMAVAGMAGAVGAVTGAVVTGMVMVFEMIRDFDVIAPLLITTALAYGLRRLLLEDSVYTMKLARRGHYIPELRQTSAYLLESAGRVLRVPVVTMTAEQWTAGMPDAAAGAPHVLITEHGRLYGVVPAEQVQGRLEHSPTHGDPHGSVQRFVVVRADQPVASVVASLRAARLPAAVVSVDGRAERPEDVLGVLSGEEIVRGGNLPLRLLRFRPSPDRERT
ncbi:MAG: chloride channel protein [Gammaproteobacteria bacterium]